MIEQAAQSDVDCHIFFRQRMKISMSPADAFRISIKRHGCRCGTTREESDFTEETAVRQSDCATIFVYGSMALDDVIDSIWNFVLDENTFQWPMHMFGGGGQPAELAGAQNLDAVAEVTKIVFNPEINAVVKENADHGEIGDAAEDFPKQWIKQWSARNRGIVEPLQDEAHSKDQAQMKLVAHQQR